MGQVTITLNGRGYRLNCGTGEEDRLRELASDLNLRLERLAVDYGQHGGERLLVMAALLLTDELLELKARLGAKDSDEAVEETEIAPPVVANGGAPVEAPAVGKSEPEPMSKPEPDAAPAKAADPARAAANPARPTPHRLSLEARLAEAKAGRPSAKPTSGAA
jgi:cell division protein ZapA (FtsZ GTPase activity inhibitor)